MEARNAWILVVLSLVWFDLCDISTTELTKGLAHKRDNTESSPDEENGVLILTKKNFDSVVKSKRIILVLFSHPKCRYCVTLSPKYDNAAENLKTNDPPLLLAKVNGDKEKYLVDKYDIHGYPTMKLFVDGEEKNIAVTPRDEEGIIKFMKKQSDKVPKELPRTDHIPVRDNFTDSTPNTL